MRNITMTKLHFEDLTQITCPFGMLNDGMQSRLMACDDVEVWDGQQWVNNEASAWFCYYTYRAKPKPKRVVSWLQWDHDDEAVCCEYRNEAGLCIREYGGYIYKIERDEDGSNPTIELVEVGGRDE